MSGSPEVTGTVIGNSFCKGEGQLKRSAGYSAALSIDVVYVRDLVAQDVITPEGGIERAEHAGSLSPYVKSQLFDCLTVISHGECPFFPKY